VVRDIAYLSTTPYADDKQKLDLYVPGGAARPVMLWNAVEKSGRP
jgi:hypothetical protein